MDTLIASARETIMSALSELAVQTNVPALTPELLDILTTVILILLSVVALLVLYLMLIFGAIHVAGRCESVFGRLVAAGIVGMWTFQIFENIGMCIGLMPITGIPLPFISFGSSSMMVQLLVVGVLQSIWRHRSKPA